MSDVLIISNQGLSPLHLGIELEVIATLLDKGKSVAYSTCGKSIGSCFFNPTGNPIGCGICQGRNIVFHELIKNNLLTHIPFPKIDISNYLPNYDIKYNSDIENWELNGVKFGRGVLSSVISLKRDYDVFQENLHSLIKEETKVALKSLLAFSVLCNDLKPNEVIVFNGRFSETFPIVSYCKSKGISFQTMEVGATDQKYELFENNLPHSISARKKNMLNLWNKASNNKVELAEKWFLDKTLGQNKDDFNYISQQVKSKLPINFDNEKINISIFNSSEDEMKTIEEWHHDIYKTQNDAIRTIVTHFLNFNEFHFYLRNHPNLGNVNNAQTKEIAQFNFSNLTVISSFDSVDSYELVKSSDVVLSFGSTIGVEATYHGKISIMFGKSFYTNMDAVYEPKNFEELFKMIKNFKDLTPKSKENTFPYVFYISNRGEYFKQLKYNGKHNSFFKNVKIKRFYPISILLIVKYLISFSTFIKKFKVLYNKLPSILDLGKLKI